MDNGFDAALREVSQQDSDIECLRAQLASTRRVLEAYEQWEADIILENKCWTGQNIRLTDELYDRMIEIQGMRNAALTLSNGDNQ